MLDQVSVRWRRATACITILSSLSISASAGERPKVLVVMPDQAISDSERADILTLATRAVPYDQWPVVPRKAGDAYATVLDRYLDYYKGAGPETTDALIGAMHAASATLTPEQRKNELKLPPVPVRANTTFDFAPAIRSFDLGTSAYAPPAATPEHNFIDNRLLEAKKSPNRRATTTELRFDAATLVHLAANLPRANFFAHALVISEDGFAQVRLLDSSAPADCAKCPAWFASSPYIDLYKNRQSSYGPALAALKKKAAAEPLVIIDWDVNDTDPVSAGHGSKVLSVAHYVTQLLGLSDLDPYIQTVELNPKRNPGLKNDLEAFRLAVYNEPKFKSYFDDAKKWIDKPFVTDTGSIQNVPDLLIQALMWKWFEKNHAWVNFSLAVTSDALQIIAPRFLVGTQSFGVVAALDDPGETTPVAPLQAASSKWENFVTVTYGDPSGMIWGSTTNSKYPSSVDVIAPGCGFQHLAIAPADHGASFASPVVATSAWLKHLLDGTGPFAMRREVIDASLMIPKVKDEITAGGFFDPRMLLSGRGVQLLGANGKVVSIAKGTFHLSFGGANDSRTMTLTVPADPALSDQHYTFYLGESGGKPVVWVRHYDRNNARYVAGPSPLISLTFDGTTATGDELKLDQQHFLSTYVSFTY